MNRSPRIALLAALFACACSADDPASPASGGAGAGGAGSGGGPVSTGGVSPAGGTPSGGMATMGGSAQGGFTSGGSAAIAGASGSAAATGGSSAAGNAGAAGGSAGAGAGGASGGSAGSAGSGGSGGSGGSAGGLPDPGTKGDGDITIGDTYKASPDLTSNAGPASKTFSFSMSSTTSMFYTGMDATLTTRQSFMRNITVHVPAKYRDGSAAPFMIVTDGPGGIGLGNRMRDAIRNLSHGTNPERTLPAIVLIAVAHGGGDSKGSQRGLEYDTISDRYARFIDEEVLPAVLAHAPLKAAYPNFALTQDPEGRGTVGCSSGGAAALTMAWFKPDKFRRVIAYSATLVDQQDDDAPEEAMYPLGAWDYHSGKALVANSPIKPLRIFINANQNDNGATQAETSTRNWLSANRRMAAALKAQGYHYRFVYGLAAGHCDGKVYDADLPDTMLWVWRGYPLTAP